MKLFIFGSTGDLVRRKVIPALAGMKINDLQIIALGRKDFTSKDYENFVGNEEGFKSFKIKPVYQKIQFDNLKYENCENLLDKNGINFFYIAMPPSFIEKILSFMGRIKERGFKVKILIEKPFGDSLKNAENLKKLIAEKNLTDDVLISDHYLFKEEIIGLEKMNFSRIKLVSLETVGLENRSYYDEIGALKDMLQSHFLNIVFKLLENPEEEFSDFKILKYIRKQYGNGLNKGYAKDLGKKSDTETFVKILLKTKTKEFEFITGKRFDKKLAFIEIDNKKIYLESYKDPYMKLFLDFFFQKKENFATIQNSLLAWKIIEKIEAKKQELEYYPEESSTEETAV